MTDLEALRAYSERQDAESFQHLINTYQGMVYSACKRMLASHADIEEVVQDVFVALAHNAGRIHTNPASWLYACAVSKARDRRRSDGSRADREQEWTELQTIESGGDFRSLEPIIDDCIDQLPDDERELILQHFMLGVTQTSLAESEGVSQPAVKKRLDKAVDHLREKLRKAGVAASVAVLGSFLLTSEANAAVPTELSGSLAKIGLVGVGKGSGVALGTLTFAKVAVIMVLLVGMGGIGFMLWGPGSGSGQTSPQDQAQTTNPQKTATTDSPKGKEKKMNDQVIIEGVKEIRYKGFQVREFECIAVAAEAAGLQLDYVDCMGLSGMAFRIHYLPRMAVCPSIVSPRYGFRADEVLFNGVDGLSLVSTDDMAQSDYEKLITDQIDLGIPVPAKGPWWYGVIVGYDRQDGFKLIVREAEKEEYCTYTGKASIVFLLNKPKYDKKLVDEALKTAVRIAETESFGEYTSGFKAFSDWARMMRSSGVEFDQQVKAHAGDGGIKNCNYWQYRTVIAARKTAAAYLTRIADRYDGDKAASIKEAAALYADVAKALEQGLSNEWTPESRAKQADALDAALAIERNAVAALKKCL